MEVETIKESRKVKTCVYHDVKQKSRGLKVKTKDFRFSLTEFFLSFIYLKCVSEIPAYLLDLDSI